MVLWIAVGLLVVGAAVWAILRLSNLEGKSENELRVLFRTGDWLSYEQALAELRRRGLDISAYVPLVVDLLTHESKFRRSTGWRAVREYYPGLAALLPSFNPGAPHDVCERMVQEKLPETARITVRLDYARSILLDAENLAEHGIGEAFRTKVAPLLRGFIPAHAVVDEVEDIPGDYTYSVMFRGREFIVYSPEVDNSAGQSWGRAMYALFTVVNEQLAASTHRFYAINGGNDLEGMFLTPADAEAARRGLPRKSDWPYLPTLEDTWYGAHHD